MEGDLRAELRADKVLEVVCVCVCVCVCERERERERERKRERDWGKSGREGDTENLLWPKPSYELLTELCIHVGKCKTNRKWKLKVRVKLTQSCLTLCDPMDYTLSSSSVHGILQARILKWVAVPFTGGSSQPGIRLRSPELRADSLPSEPPGKPKIKTEKSKNLSSDVSCCLKQGK